MRADAAEDGLTDLSDESAGLRQEREQDLHKHLNPMRLLFLSYRTTNHSSWLQIRDAPIQLFQLRFRFRYIAFAYWFIPDNHPIAPLN